MKSGRQLDLAISSEVMEYVVKQQKREIYESTAKGSRPLHPYSSDISAAWEVVEKLGVSLIPIEGGGWFALVGGSKGWKSPADFLSYIQNTDFTNSGAAVAETAPMAICIAALKAIQCRKSQGTFSKEVAPVTH